MEETQKDSAAIFASGAPAPASYFTGTVSVKMLVEKSDDLPYSVGNVDFQPGARTNWHTHPAGQNLLVTDGNGFYQERDKPARPIKKGDVVQIPADVEHWHGASKDHGLVHIAITNFKEDKNVIWLQPVNGEEYAQAGKTE